MEERDNSLTGGNIDPLFTCKSSQEIQRNRENLKDRETL